MASRPIPTGKKVVPTNTTKTTNAPVSDPTLEGNDEQLRHSAVIRNAIQKTSAATEQPTEQSTQNCESNNMALDVLPMVANQLYLEAKEQLEQTGYIKGVVKEKVISNLSQMYKIVLRLNDSRLKLMDKLTASEEQDITKLELVKQIGIENDLKASKILEHLKMQSDNIQETKLQMESIKEEVIKLSDDIMRHTPVENMTYAQKIKLDSDYIYFKITNTEDWINYLLIKLRNKGQHIEEFGHTTAASIINKADLLRNIVNSGEVPPRGWWRANGAMRRRRPPPP
ncbi:hypothetical protein K1T71_003316 [Dendrolimus kikuchii]|uniref:Uncharacterized protein n=1 Tax=Dendrolimus kikuchii TaxID=765133 RepID=A0ACC1DC44_9NEOP|nr:hypothetical protein K1T71_003316 [Dendrolimus kikuchii]